METARGGRRAAGPGALAAFARFVLCGGGVGLASSFAVAALASWMYWGLANALVTAASTLLATELHARFTFGAGGRATWRQHVQSSGSAAAAYAVTCAAMLTLHLVVASPGAVLEQAVYLSASGLAGAARFVVLRLVVFARGHMGGVQGTAVATRRGSAGGMGAVPGARPVPCAGPIPGACPVPAVASRVAAPGGQAELCRAA